MPVGDSGSDSHDSEDRPTARDGGERGPMTRRRLLGLSGVALTSALAGCPGGDGGTATPDAATDARTATATPAAMETPTLTSTATDVGTPTPTDASTATATETPTPSYDVEPVFDEFVGTDGTRFVVDGEPYYPVGGNHPQLRKQTEQEQRLWLEEWQKRCDVNVLRATAFGTGTQRTTDPLQPAPGERNEAAFEKLDRLLALCGAAGVRVVLPLANYWDWQGGIPQYVEWSGEATEKNEFYDASDCQEWYRSHVEYVLERTNTYTGLKYKNDPTVLMWELANEPDGGDAFLEWVGETARFIESIDDNHLVSTGMADPYPWDTEEKSRAAHGTEGIDAYSLHVWADEEHAGIGVDGGVRRIRDHAAVAEELGIPIYMGEFGWSIKRTEDPSRTYTEAYRNLAYRAYFLAMREEGYAGSLVWDLRHSLEYPLGWNLQAVYPRDERTAGIIEAAYAEFSSPPSDEPRTDVRPPTLSVTTTEGTGSETALVPNTDGGAGDEVAFHLAPEGDTYTDPDGDSSSVEPSDVSADFYLGYDADNFYLRAEVTDDAHHAKSGSSMWQQDSVQMALGLNGTYGPEYGMSAADGGSVHRWHAGQSTEGASAVGLSTSRDGSTTTYDATYPWETLFADPPSAGDAFPFSVLVNDNDQDDDARSNVLGWTLPGVNSEKSPDALGTAVLESDGPAWNLTKGQGPYLTRVGERNTWTAEISNVGGDAQSFDVSVAGTDAAKSVEVSGGNTATVSVERAFAALGGARNVVEVTPANGGGTRRVAFPVMVLGK